MMDAMCWECIEDAGAENEPLTAEMAELVDLIAEFYDMPDTEDGRGMTCGGPLHIVLDDSNVNDSDIVWCLNEAAVDWPDDVAAAAERIGVGLLLLSIAQRTRVVNDYLFSGIIH